MDPPPYKSRSDASLPPCYNEDGVYSQLNQSSEPDPPIQAGTPPVEFSELELEESVDETVPRSRRRFCEECSNSSAYCWFLLFWLLVLISGISVAIYFLFKSRGQ